MGRNADFQNDVDATVSGEFKKKTTREYTEGSSAQKTHIEQLRRQDVRAYAHYEDHNDFDK